MTKKFPKKKEYVEEVNILLDQYIFYDKKINNQLKTYLHLSKKYKKIEKRELGTMVQKTATLAPP